MALPVLHKSAVPGYRTSERLGYTYVGADDFSENPTIEDVYSLFLIALIGPGARPTRPDIALIISGWFFQPYPGHDPNEDVTTLSYALNATTAWESVRAHYEESPGESAVAWVNDLIQNFSQGSESHNWLAVYRISIVD